MYGFYFACCILYELAQLLAQLVKYHVHKTRKIKSIHAISYHILLLYMHRKYTPHPGKKGATLFFVINLPNPNGSSKFFHRHTQQ